MDRPSSFLFPQGLLLAKEVSGFPCSMVTEVSAYLNGWPLWTKSQGTNSLGGCSQAEWPGALKVKNLIFAILSLPQVDPCWFLKYSQSIFPDCSVVKYLISFLCEYSSNPLLQLYRLFFFFFFLRKLKTFKVGFLLLIFSIILAKSSKQYPCYRLYSGLPWNVFCWID